MSNKLSKQDIKKVYIRNLFGLQLGWNYEKMQGLGYAYVIMPMLKKLYKTDEEMAKALKLHLGFFNTTPAVSNLIVGANMALEEEIGLSEPNAIAGLKTGLMGPLAGVGDTIFIAIYRAIFFSIAAYLALEGQVIGLSIPVVACLGVIWIRYKFTLIGYTQGRRLVTEFAGKMKLFTEGASILGLTVVGALVPSVVKVAIPLEYKMGEVTLSIQGMLDQILPGLLPLGVVLFSYWLLGRKNMNSTKLIFVLIGLGMIIGNLQNIFGFVGGML